MCSAKSHSQFLELPSTYGMTGVMMAYTALAARAFSFVCKDANQNDSSGMTVVLACPVSRASQTQA